VQLLVCPIPNFLKKRKVIYLVLVHPSKNPLCALVVGELSLFKRLSILASTCAYPLS
jgi:hypothetical protein